MSNFKKDTETAPAPVDMTALLGRFDVIQQSVSEGLLQLGEAIAANAEVLSRIEDRLGQLVAGAPRDGREPTPLTVEKIEAIVRARPSASFRVLAPCAHASLSWAKGAIIRPQVMEPSVWRALLQRRVQLEDADENP